MKNDKLGKHILTNQAMFIFDQNHSTLIALSSLNHMESTVEIQQKS